MSAMSTATAYAIFVAFLIGAAIITVGDLYLCAVEACPVMVCADRDGRC